MTYWELVPGLPFGMDGDGFGGYASDYGYSPWGGGSGDGYGHHKGGGFGDGPGDTQGGNISMRRQIPLLEVTP